MDLSMFQNISPEAFGQVTGSMAQQPVQPTMQSPQAQLGAMKGGNNIFSMLGSIGQIGQTLSQPSSMPMQPQYKMGTRGLKMPKYQDGGTITSPGKGGPLAQIVRRNKDQALQQLNLTPYDQYLQNIIPQHDPNNPLANDYYDAEGNPIDYQLSTGNMFKYNPQTGWQEYGQDGTPIQYYQTDDMGVANPVYDIQYEQQVNPIGLGGSSANNSVSYYQQAVSNLQNPDLSPEDKQYYQQIVDAVKDPSQIQYGDTLDVVDYTASPVFQPRRYDVRGTNQASPNRPVFIDAETNQETSLMPNTPNQYRKGTRSLSLPKYQYGGPISRGEASPLVQNTNPLAQSMGRAVQVMPQPMQQAPPASYVGATAGINTPGLPTRPPQMYDMRNDVMSEGIMERRFIPDMGTIEGMDIVPSRSPITPDVTNSILQPTSEQTTEQTFLQKAKDKLKNVDTSKLEGISDYLALFPALKDLGAKAEINMPQSVQLERMRYEDTSDPMRQQVRQSESTNREIVRNMAGGNTAVALANSQRAGANRVEQMNQIEQQEANRRIGIDQTNNQIANQEELTNTQYAAQSQLANEQNRARAEDMRRQAIRDLASSYSEIRRNKNMRKRDEVIMSENKRANLAKEVLNKKQVEGRVAYDNAYLDFLRLSNPQAAMNYQINSPTYNSK